MARFRWTDEALAELRRLMNYDLPYEEIARRFGNGCTANAARCRAYKMGWTGHGRAGRIRGDRLKGKPRDPAVIAKMSATAKANWSDPAYRDRVAPIIAETNRKPKRCAKIRRACELRRGFAIPSDKADEYRFLTNNKSLTAREAGAVLGLIPSHQTTTRGA